MDSAVNSKETYLCQVCHLYIQNSYQQAHEAKCSFKNLSFQNKLIQQNQSWKNNIQNKITFNNCNNLQQSQINFKGKNQNSPPQFQFISINNSEGISNQEKVQSQLPSTPIQNPQQEFNQFKKDSTQSNEQTKMEQFHFQKLQVQFPLQNQSKNQILLNQQQQKQNFSQFKNDQIFNQNINNQQSQNGIFSNFKSQFGDQDQIYQHQNQNQKDLGMRIQFQHNFNKPQFPQPSSQIINSTENTIFNQKNNLQQNQPQEQESQFQQEKYTQNNEKFQKQNKFTPFLKKQAVNNSNMISFNNSFNSLPQQNQVPPIQLTAPQIPEYIQPAPFNYQIQPSFMLRLQQEDKYDQFQNSYGGLPNFDVNKKYTDYDVNKMNQEQIYQYFSNLYINEDHGYTEDQINQKLNKNFQIQMEENAIDICVICQESFTSETFTTDKQLPCSHLFHVDCLQGWLKRSKNCPICKTLIVL